MREPIVSVAGVRGIVGESLIPDDYLRRLMAFATMVNGKKIVVGGDSRLSRTMLRHLSFAGLIASGYEVHDLGICPTPTVGFMVRHLKADCGLAITASHNPAEWNAFKFFSKQGTFITKKENAVLQKIFKRREFSLADVWHLGEVKQVKNPLEPHLKKVLEAVDVSTIRRRKFRVVVDCVNGAGSEVIPELLHRLGCQIKTLYTDMNKPFPHEPEPLPKNLTQLSKAVRQFRADIGFAIDPDADRLALVDDKGDPLGEERTLVLCTYHYLATRGNTPVVVNLSVTRAIDDVAKMFGVKVFRTPVGEANVVEKMLAISSRVGGEGNGGIIIPAIHAGRDASTGIAFILETLAHAKKSITELNKVAPDYIMLKIKISRDPKADVTALLKKFEAAFSVSARKVERKDGIKITLKNGNWVNARASGTEPIMRIFAEAPTHTEAQDLIMSAQRALK